VRPTFLGDVKPGETPVQYTTRKARELYERETANHPTIHCNRFPSWDELTFQEREKWFLELYLEKVNDNPSL
jgi:hypothetical protein